MDLYHGHIDGGDGIGDGKGCVGVGAGVEYDAVHEAEATFVEAVDDGAFAVALEIVDDGAAGECGARVVDNLFHGLRAVYLGLAAACEVEVGAVDDQEVLHASIFS